MSDEKGKPEIQEVASLSTSSIVPPRTERPVDVFEIRAKALHLYPGFNLDDIGELLEQVEGPAHR
jgi:hypothetical protein